MKAPARFRNVVATLLLAQLPWISPLPAAITGQWDFQSGTLAATIGAPLEYVDGPEGATAQQTVFGTTAALGLPGPGGATASVMGFPRSLPSMGYRISPGIAANGGGVLANQYTLILDVLFPAASANLWRAILQIDDPANGNDAELFINPAGAIGISGQYQGAVQADTWHRLAFAVDLADPAGPQLRKYIDGQLVGQQTLGSGVDGRWALSPIGGPFGDYALLFTDDNADGGNVQPGFVSSIQIHDEALSSAYLAALGAPTTDSIPQSVQVPASVVRRSPVSGAMNVLPGAILEAVLQSGSQPLDPATVSLSLNGQALSPTVTAAEGLLTVRAPLPSLAAKSENAVRLRYTDPALGEVNAEWSFRMAPYGEEPALAAGLGTGLVAHWPLDDAAANPAALAAVDIVSDNRGTLETPDPAAAWLSGGDARFGGALRVDGSSTFVTVPASDSLDLGSDQVSVSLWVKLGQLPAELGEGFGGVFDSTQDAYALYLDRSANEFRFKVTDATGHAARPGIPADRLVTGEWLHVVAVYDGRASASAGEARIYLNGEVADTHVGNDGAGGTGLTGAVRTGQVTGWGRDGSEARYFLNADLDDIGVWKRALTIDEIGYLTAGKVIPEVLPPTDPLTIVTPPSNASVLDGTRVSFRVVISGGVPPITYAWRRNGVDVPGANQSQLSLVASSETAGTYTAVITDARESIETTPVTLAVTPLATEPAESLKQGLVALWPLDDGVSNPGATAVVDVARGNPATLTAPDPATAWLDALGARFGGALRVNGQDSYVSVPPSDILNIGADQVTVAAWVRLAALPSALPEGFGGVFDSVEDNYVLYLDRGNAELRFKVTDAAGQAARPGIPEADLLTGEWLHVVGVYDGRATAGAGEARIYLNGDLIDSHLGNDGSGGAGLTGLVRAGQAAAIGRNGTENRYFLEADIDDVAVWSRALSVTEIEYLAAGQAVPVPAPTPSLRLTGASLSGATVTLQWEGGRPPYQVQRRASLTDGAWENVGSTTDATSLAVPLEGATGFFRVSSPSAVLP